MLILGHREKPQRSLRVLVKVEVVNAWRSFPTMPSKDSSIYDGETLLDYVLQ